MYYNIWRNNLFAMVSYSPEQIKQLILINITRIIPWVYISSPIKFRSTQSF